MYITEENNINLKLASAHAIDKAKNDFPIVRFGEGVVGQAAAEKRNVLLTDICGLLYNQFKLW